MLSGIARSLPSQDRKSAEIRAFLAPAREEQDEGCLLQRATKPKNGEQRATDPKNGQQRATELKNGE